MTSRLPACRHCGRSLRRQARATVQYRALPGMPTIGACEPCLEAGHTAELPRGAGLAWDYLSLERPWALCQMAHVNVRSVVAGPAFWRLADEVGIRRRVRCWVCGHRAQRVPVGVVGVVGERALVLDYGSCPNIGLGYDCDGHFFTLADCRRVVRRRSGTSGAAGIGDRSSISDPQRESRRIATGSALPTFLSGRVVLFGPGYCNRSRARLL